MQSFKAILIVMVIVVSLLPVYVLYQYLHWIMRPRASFRRFLIWLFTVLSMVFVYTFLLVLLIKLLFPGA